MHFKKNEVIDKAYINTTVKKAFQDLTDGFQAAIKLSVPEKPN